VIWFLTPQGYSRSNLTVSIESPWLLSEKSSLSSVTIFKVFRIKGLWAWPLTSKGHPKWSPWAQHRNSSILAVFHVKSMTLIIDPSRSPKVKSDGASWKPVSPICKCSGGRTALRLVRPGYCTKCGPLSDL